MSTRAGVATARLALYRQLLAIRRQEIGFGAITEIRQVQALRYLGPLPPGLQSYTTYYGALVNGAGQLVGINTAAAQAGSAENVGFSIAIDSALPIIRQLSTEAPSQRAWLGVGAKSVDASVASLLGLPTSTRGALVASVFSGSPAAKAGIRQGEVIVSFGGTTVASEADLSSAIAAHKPGDVVQVGLLSTQGSRTVSVTLGTRPPGV